MSSDQGRPNAASEPALPSMSDEHRWGEPITEERARELDERLRAWEAEGEADHGDRRSAFEQASWDGQLTGADVFHLAARALSGLHVNAAALEATRTQLRDRRRRLTLDLPALHLEGADLSQAHLEDAYLHGAHLEGAYLRQTHLERANLRDAHLERATFFSLHGPAYLEGANLSKAHLEGADLGFAHLLSADLSLAHLVGTRLSNAFLQGADLRWARLDRATLDGAHLEGADLHEAHLTGATLIGASFDKTSHLNSAVLTNANFDQAIFDGTNLTVVDWSLVTILGDERIARAGKDTGGKRKDAETRLIEYKAAMRANRVLAVALQAQGLAEDAAHFSYRAQVLQREVLRRQGKSGTYLFSLLIATLAGYGYRLGRILIAYGLVVTLFAAGFFFSGHTLGAPQVSGDSIVQGVLDALQISLNAIHGRVFFAQFGLDTLQSWLATLESVVGIVIEGVFVAMLIQRFFGR